VKLTALKSIFIIVAVAMLVIMLLAVLKWVRQRDEFKMTAACIVNLQVIEASKEQWALENNKDSNAVPTWKDLNPFLINTLIDEHEKDELHCPAGGVYTIGRVGVFPTCSIPQHIYEYTPSEFGLEVESENGSNLVGATVELLDASGRKAVSHAGRDGVAFINTWTNAVLFVIVSKPGYVTVSNTLEAIWNSPGPLQLKRVEPTNGVQSDTNSSSTSRPQNIWAADVQNLMNVVVSCFTNDIENVHVHHALVNVPQRLYYSYVWRIRNIFSESL
jgi:hypothetical protein